MLKGECHCGSISWQFDSVPDGATACNCTICRRYGALWIYGHEGVDVHVSGQTAFYERGKALEFHYCPKCACITHWRAKRLEPDGKRRLAVNVRLSDPSTVEHLPIDHFDGFDSFDDLPRDGKTVKHYWF